jgi:tartrate dehydratase beta subunit/fumarate hydratase class I family protein
VTHYDIAPPVTEAQVRQWRIGDTVTLNGTLYGIRDGTQMLMREHGVRVIIGKGGLGEGSLAAFKELGGVYLAVVGGAAALETTWVEAIEDVDLDDLNPESLWTDVLASLGVKDQTR